MVESGSRQATTNEKVLGLVFYEMVLTKKSEDISAVTDRLLVSDEAVQVMDFHRYPS